LITGGGLEIRHDEFWYHGKERLAESTQGVIVMSTLLLKRGSHILQTTYMVFPEGGLSEMAELGLKVAGSAMGHGIGKVVSYSGKAQERIHKYLLGGATIPGVLHLYTDYLEFDPAIPRILASLYRGIEKVRLDYSQVLSLETKKVKFIYNVVDLRLDNNGFCRITDMFASHAKQIAEIIRQQLPVRRPFSLGQAVLVQWADGAHYPGIVVDHSVSHVAVRMSDGRVQWMEPRWLSPRV
jgi:hypothetical protein